MSLLAGNISVGSEFDEPCDGGATTLRMRLDPPEPAEGLEAYGVDPAADGPGSRLRARPTTYPGSTARRKSDNGRNLAPAWTSLG
jgi:hypothetical protein